MNLLILGFDQLTEVVFVQWKWCPSDVEGTTAASLRQHGGHAFESARIIEEMFMWFKGNTNFQIFNKSFQECHEVFSFSDVSWYRFLQQIVRKYCSQRRIEIRLGLNMTSVFSGVSWTNQGSPWMHPRLDLPRPPGALLQASRTRLGVLPHPSLWFYARWIINCQLFGLTYSSILSPSLVTLLAAESNMGLVMSMLSDSRQTLSKLHA